MYVQIQVNRLKMQEVEDMDEWKAEDGLQEEQEVTAEEEMRCRSLCMADGSGGKEEA